MKILITGGAGFQGSHMVEHFHKQGHDITVINTFSDRAKRVLDDLNLPINCVWGSITDKELIDKTVRDHDVVFHLAARINVDESIKYPKSYLDVNIYGTYNILEAVRKHKNRLIHASTCEVYGNPRVEKRLLDEATPMRPHSPYAASKAAADRLCFSYYKTYGVDATIVRPFNIYGERQKENAGGAAIAIFVKKALNHENIMIFGDGKQTRDYMNVHDLIDAYNIVFDNKDLSGEAINFGSGHEVSIIEIAQYIAKKLDVDIEYKDPRPGEVKSFMAADITKAKKYNFQPKISIWEGIDRYIEWRKKY